MKRLKMDIGFIDAVKIKVNGKKVRDILFEVFFDLKKSGYFRKKQISKWSIKTVVHRKVLKHLNEENHKVAYSGLKKENPQEYIILF